MSKEIVLSSKDNKYRCVVELSDSKDRFGCPDHSFMTLIEMKDDKIFVLAQARDNLLQTEKDLKIKQLKQQLEEKEKLLKCYQDEEKLIAKILGDESLTIIGSRVHLENLIVELKNKIRDRDLIIEEKDKEIENFKDFVSCKGCVDVIKKSNENQTQLAIQKLEKVNGILTDTIIEVTQNEFDINKLCYLEEISAQFYEKIQQQIKKLKGE